MEEDGWQKKSEDAPPEPHRLRPSVPRDAAGGGLSDIQMAQQQMMVAQRLYAAAHQQLANAQPHRWMPPPSGMMLMMDSNRPPTMVPWPGPMAPPGIVPFLPQMERPFMRNAEATNRSGAVPPEEEDREKEGRGPDIDIENIRVKRMKKQPSVTSAEQVHNSPSAIGWHRRSLRGEELSEFAANNLLGSLIDSEASLIKNVAEKAQERMSVQRRMARVLMFFSQHLDTHPNLKADSTGSMKISNVADRNFEIYLNTIPALQSVFFGETHQNDSTGAKEQASLMDLRRQPWTDQEAMDVMMNWNNISSQGLSSGHLLGLSPSIWCRELLSGLPKSMERFSSQNGFLTLMLLYLHTDSGHKKVLESVNELVPTGSMGSKLLLDGLEAIVQGRKVKSAISIIQRCSAGMDRISCVPVDLFDKLRWHLIVLLVVLPVKSSLLPPGTTSDDAKRKMIAMVLATTTLRTYLSVFGCPTPPLVVARRPHAVSRLYTKHETDPVPPIPSFPPKQHLSNSIWPGASHISWPTESEEVASVGTPLQNRENRVRFSTCSVVMSDMSSQTPWQVGADPTVHLQLALVGLQWPGLDVKILTSEQPISIPDQSHLGTLCCFPPLQLSGSPVDLCAPRDPLVPTAYDGRVYGSDEDVLEPYRMSYIQQQSAVGRRKSVRSRGDDSGGENSDEVAEQEPSVESESPTSGLAPEVVHLARVTHPGRALPSTKQLNAQRTKLVHRSSGDHPFDSFLSPCPYGLRHIQSEPLRVIPTTTGPSLRRFKEAIGLVDRSPPSSEEVQSNSPSSTVVEEEAHLSVTPPLVSPAMTQVDQRPNKAMKQLDGLWQDALSIPNNATHAFANYNFAKTLPILKAHPGLVELFCMSGKMLDFSGEGPSAGSLFPDSSFLDIRTVESLAMLVENMDRLMVKHSVL
eukprot:GHVH01007363.1.p1 GENE.GHVH01007363.1~~GHVH01007363.1.p1  ORF type:complete len:916 (+),score=105.58 GHVH01007363.1:2658-5405(+)